MRNGNAEITLESKMNVQSRIVKDIRPYGKNAKKHDKKQIANVAESIRQYGFVQPIVVDRDGVIVIGHCRFEAAKKLGMKEVPCVCVDDLTPEQVNALRIVDNKSNESPWDFELLNSELKEIDLSGFDFDIAIDPNDIPTVKKVELNPYRKVHYLISADIDKNDEIMDVISVLRNKDGVEIDSTLN